MPKFGFIFNSIIWFRILTWFLYKFLKNKFIYLHIFHIFSRVLARVLLLVY